MYAPEGKFGGEHFSATYRIDGYDRGSGPQGLRYREVPIHRYTHWDAATRAAEMTPRSLFLDLLSLATIVASFVALWMAMT